MTTSIKTCFKCGAEKPLADFYKHPQMSDGHVNKCKECNKKDVSANRNKNIDKYREYDRKRGSRHSIDYCKVYREKYPNKYKAHNTVNNAIRAKKLIKLPCEMCGNTEVDTHAHHDDYSEPLNVRWLCAACHSQWHRDNGEGKNPF